jgi:hypothetical protein
VSFGFSFSSEVQLDAIRRPSGNAAAKEILVLCPDWKIQQQCYGHYLPIVRVARGYALPRHAFKVSAKRDLTSHASYRL